MTWDTVVVLAVIVGLPVLVLAATGVYWLVDTVRLVTRPARPIGPGGVTGACRTREAARRA